MSCVWLYRTKDGDLPGTRDLSGCVDDTGAVNYDVWFYCPWDGTPVDPKYTPNVLTAVEIWASRMEDVTPTVSIDRREKEDILLIIKKNTE